MNKFQMLAASPFLFTRSLWASFSAYFRHRKAAADARLYWEGYDFASQLINTQGEYQGRRDLTEYLDLSVYMGNAGSFEKGVRALLNQYATFKQSC